jgi:hypothetical protein
VKGAQMGHRIFAIIAWLACTVPVAMSEEATPPKTPSFVVSPAVIATPIVRLAQAMSPRCSTPAGICLVAPLPTGSPCTCGSVAGTIIP